MFFLSTSILGFPQRVRTSPCIPLLSNTKTDLKLNWLAVSQVLAKINIFLAAELDVGFNKTWMWWEEVRLVLSLLYVWLMNNIVIDELCGH